MDANQSSCFLYKCDSIITSKQIRPKRKRKDGREIEREKEIEKNEGGKTKKLVGRGRKR